MAEARSSFSESSSADHPGAAANDDIDEYELQQRVEKIELVFYFSFRIQLFKIFVFFFRLDAKSLS